MGSYRFLPNCRCTSYAENPFLVAVISIIMAYQVLNFNFDFHHSAFFQACAIVTFGTLIHPYVLQPVVFLALTFTAYNALFIPEGFKMQLASLFTAEFVKK